MILRTTGIAMRIDPFSKTSVIVNWLTADRGRLTTLVKSAQRPRHMFLGHCDLFQTCELLYYAGRNSTLHILRECCATEFRVRFRTEWRRTVCASYLCDLLNRMSHPETPIPDIYRFASRTLDFLEREGSSAAVLHWAESRLLRLFGVAPRLGSCAGCGKPLEGCEGPLMFSVPRGGVLCSGCRTEAGAGIYPIAADVLAMLRTWQQAATPTIALRTAFTPEQQDAVEKILGAFVEYHLESSKARRIALDMLGTERIGPAIRH